MPMQRRHSAFLFAVTLWAPVAFAQATPPSGTSDGAPSEAAEPDDAAPGDSEPAPAAAATEAKPPPRTETDDVFSELESSLSGPSSPARSEPTRAKPAGQRGAQSLNPDLAFIADFAAAWFSEREHAQTGGHDPTRTGMNLQALELNARSVVDPYLRFDANLVFAEDGVELEEAYATTLDLPLGLQARFGQLLTRFGRINSTHPHAWDFADQPFALGRIFGAEGNRGLGAEASWLVPLPWYTELVGTVLHADGEGSARSFYGSQELHVDSVTDLLYVTALKQFFELHENWSLLWGLSAAFGPNPNGPDNRTAVYATDLYLKYRPITRESTTQVTWQTEVMHRRRQIPDALLWDVSGYSQVFWRFARRFGAALRYEYGSPAYYASGVVARDPLDPEWTDTRQRMSAALSHWPSEFSRFRLQASRDAGGPTRGVWAAFLTAELVVGAHGAHTF